MDSRFRGNDDKLSSRHLEHYTHCAFFHNRFTRTVPNKSYWVVGVSKCRRNWQWFGCRRRTTDAEGTQPAAARQEGEGLLDEHEGSLRNVA